MIPLSNIVDVSVEVSSQSFISSNFNLGLIIGDSEVLTAETRVKLYSKTSYLQDMPADGFANDSDEYLAAQAYFRQNKNVDFVAIGVKLAEETDLQAITACREFNENFYSVCFAYNTVDTDMDAVAAASEVFSVPTVLFLQTSDANCLVASSDNLMSRLKEASLTRTVTFYTENQKYVAASVVGLFVGLNSMERNSAYTLAYKSLVGIASEAVNQVQLAVLSSYNGNAYVSFGGRYNLTYPAVVASGMHIDELYMLDAVKHVIQQYAVSGLINSRVIPQTDSGVAQISSFIVSACEKLLEVGFIASGIWTGDAVLELQTNDAIPNGYYVQAISIAEQSPEDYQQRKSPPIYVALKAAGAIEHIVVNVLVNQ